MRVELKPNEIKLLSILLRTQKITTARDLAAFCDCSIRSIKNYVKSINEHYDSLVTSTHEGYEINDKEKAVLIVNRNNQLNVPNDFSERKTYILKKLLIEHNSYSMVDFANEMYISEDTLLGEINKIRKFLIDFDLTLKIKQDSLIIDGPAYNKKRLLSQLIVNESKKTFLSLHLMQEYLPAFDLQTIKSIIEKTVISHHYFMDDFSILNFVLHIAITMERPQYENGYDVNNRIEIPNNVNDIINEISDEINEKFNTSFSQNEKYYFGLLIMTRLISKNITKITKLQYREVIGSRIIDLVNIIQEHLDDNFNINFTSNHDFKLRFSLHIKNLLTRLDNDIVLQNIQMQSIKNSYPFIYDVSVFIANIIMQESGHLLSEDEIAYIALHIGVLIEENKAVENKVRVVFLNAQYFFNSYDMVERVTKFFKEKLIVKGVISCEDDLLELTDYELIITTVPLQRSTSIPTIHVSFLINEHDQHQIDSQINSILDSRKREKIAENMTKLFREEIFFPQATFSDKDQTINKLCDALEKNDCVGPEFRDKIFEREALSPSAFVNIAMPHPLEMIAKKTSIAVSLHQKPISWNSNNVNIVFMIATNVEDKLFFKEIFDLISTIISDPQKVDLITKSKNYDEFISKLVSFL